MSTEDQLSIHPKVVAWLAGTGRWLRRADRARPWLLDALLVLAILLAFGMYAALQGHEYPTTGLPLTIIVALQFGLALPLLWRRRAPSTVFSIVLAVFLLQWSLNVSLNLPLDLSLHSDVILFLAPLVALYSLARHGLLRHLGFGCVAMLVALLLVALRVPIPVSPLVALFFLGSAATASVVLALGVRLGWAYLVELQERAARLEVERDQRSKLATAAERARIAREMHDIVGHNLSIIIGLADGGSRAADVTPARSKQALDLISGTSRQALAELRRTLTVLSEARSESGPDNTQSAELSPQPGIADLDALCERVRAAGPQVVYRTIGKPDALDPGVQLAAYRIVQESLTNTLKHAGSDTRAHLTVSANGAQLTVRIEDIGPPDGAAHHVSVGPNKHGHGIAGMRERTALYGGTITAGPCPGGGWSVDAVLPLVPVSASQVPHVDHAS
ncbi:signal transduction histidine kinase [Antricoccus suffuscus]|uniref:histidine kinase n=1 Tax=Antricoccus suffuscus TaxID=1629062 RepID=A0A2T0ZX36_9ACTN|nr:histidine kinase [Antricoccus suffuscus]PRZ40919.1 signal transduction histidine kinase [Antricoccus suffuscus]